MDDVDAELDRKRVDHLFEHLEGRTQTFVTTSREELVRRYYGRSQVLEVRGGGAAVLEAVSGEVITTSATGK